MFVWNVPRSAIQEIARQCDFKIVNLYDNLYDKFNALRFTLVPTSKQYRRIKQSYVLTGKAVFGKYCNAVCWHGYKLFMEKVYARFYFARIQTQYADYRSKEDFENKFEATGNVNRGSVMEFIRYRDLCYCESKPVPKTVKPKKIIKQSSLSKILSAHTRKIIDKLEL